MSESKTELKPIPLAELLAPTATGILNDGRVFKNKESSLWLFAQDAFGWQNWMGERLLPLEGRAEALLRQAAKQLHLPDETVDHFLAETPLDQAIPACVYKGDNENGTGEISAWAHVLNLRPEFQPYCPADTHKQVKEHIHGYRRLDPPRAHPGRRPPKRAAPTGAGVAVADAPVGLKNPLDPSIPTGEQAQGGDRPEEQLDAKHLDTRLASLGRTLVEALGDEQDGQRSFGGHYKYKITVNLSDNTMRIYAKDRGVDPILVDADGRIDHENSNVQPEDVTHFQAVVDSVREYSAYSVKTPKDRAQLEP